MYSIIEYQYRDASGYSVNDELLIEGLVSKDDLKALRPYFYDGEFFIPEEIGITPLQPMLWEKFGYSEDDHEWHKFIDVREAHAVDMHLPAWGTKEDLFRRFHLLSD